MPQKNQQQIKTGHFFIHIIESGTSRAWYNGSTSASQAEDEGSIPFARTKNQADPSVGFIFLILEITTVFFFYIRHILLENHYTIWVLQIFLHATPYMK